jgi:hypothetical protein
MAKYSAQWQALVCAIELKEVLQESKGDWFSL